MITPEEMKLLSDANRALGRLQAVYPNKDGQIDIATLGKLIDRYQEYLLLVVESERSPDPTIAEIVEKTMPAVEPEPVNIGQPDLDPATKAFAETVAEQPAGESKVCSKCKTMKPLSEFGQSYGRPKSQCKDCSNAYFKAHAAKKRAKPVIDTTADTPVASKYPRYVDTKSKAVYWVDIRDIRATPRRFTIWTDDMISDNTGRIVDWVDGDYGTKSAAQHVLDKHAAAVGWEVCQ